MVLATITAWLWAATAGADSVAGQDLAPPRIISSASPLRADLASLIDSLKTAQHVLEMYRRSLGENSPRRLRGGPISSNAVWGQLSADHHGMRR
jgi:hypothetical protein